VNETMRRFPAEWEEQDGVLMAWPHEGTDWAPDLLAAQRVTIDIARQITRYERLVLVAPDIEDAEKSMAGAGLPPDRIAYFKVPTNDTWARDFGPIIVFAGEKPLALDFGFNGWGLKFRSDLDNRITRKMATSGAFACPIQTVGLILEGGSIESDGNGTILTTVDCLLSPNRNPHLSRSGIEEFLCRVLGAWRILWIENGHLAGDDTDSHVDTLARFCPHDTILYTACDDPADEHYGAMRAMADELRSFRTPAGRPYRLLALPWPETVRDEDGQRLPATYANFLILNGAVLVPAYGSPRDSVAVEVISRAFPDRKVTGVGCLPLLPGRGSLHCITMQIPKGVLA